MADPVAGSLTLTTTDVEFTNSGDMRLVLTGHAPFIPSNTSISVSVGSLVLTGNAPERAYGLVLTGNQASVQIDHVRLISGVTAAFTGRVPTVVIAAPPSFTISPNAGAVGFTGNAPELFSGLRISPTVGSIALTGNQPTKAVDNLIHMPFPAGAEDADLVFESDAVTATLSSTQAVIGTMIVNPNATTDDSRYNICDRTGFRALPGQLVEDGYGHMVLPEHRDSRHPQEFVRSRGETFTGPKRPEPAEILDVDDLYPDGVSADDL
jgi:hypothetical protein